VRARRHQQLTQRLLGQIADGTFVVGDRLPTEEELSVMHGLARGTVRQSLGRLEELGLITRRPGAGTIVTATAPVGSYRPVALTAADMVTLAAGTKLVRPEMGEITLSDALAARLGAEPATIWFSMRGPRVRRGSDDPPLCWSEHYQPHHLPRQKLLRGDISEADVRAHTVEQIISAGLIDARMAAALSGRGADPPVTAGDPALVITRRHVTADGTLVGVEIHTHPGDRYQITMMIQDSRSISD
jgi:GntR family transcriptional regulator